MRVVLTLMAAAGGALPLAAVIWGWLSIRKDYKDLVRDLTKIDEIIEASEGTYESKDAAMLAVREPQFNLGRLTYTHEWAQRLILEQTMGDLRGPAWLGGVGVVLGATSGALSFWI
ncbi:hypothetical protein ME763_20545 [Streptomyces murinus]|uniref:hypothetical protein n=1 Tax=Streptomyces murinus TaxID=33900 RepID=UPI00117D9E18|nr:hypothetical protein [Streptomyces murinus]WDO07852.1 hypothetical protein ME763_20545 [Streptomyces murinus]